jgi:sugar phosphate isomerase/epimerase
MQLAYTTLACPDWSWQSAIQAASDYGYDGIEWRLVDGEVVTRAFPLETAQEINEAVARAGLQTCALDSSVKLTLPPGPDRDAQIEDCRGMLRVARAFGASMMRVFPGVYPESVSDEEAMGWVVDGLRSLISTAREEGVTIALETHDKFGWPRRATRGTTTSSFLAQVLSQVREPEVGVQWDIANPYLEGETADATWENIKDHLAYVHLKDMRQNPDGTWQYVPTGEGEMPITSAVDWLRASGFDGWISFEWEKKWHPELAEPEEVLPQFVTYMRELLGT